VAAAAGTAATVLERLLRPGRVSRRDTLLDVLALVTLALLLTATGLGLRGPWPPDEPRYALVARDMLLSGDWLFPRIGGDLYAEKPPLYFWLMAATMGLTGSLRVGFLVPSLLAGLGTMLLVYDLLRRARGREVALAGAFVLLISFQFAWQARQAQIDGVLCFLTTLSLYGLLRHLLLGPAPGWYVAGWAVAGLGVITKGVGFLPLLALLPFAVLARRGWPATTGRIGGLSMVGASAFVVAIGLWFVPMMLATAAGGELLEYRHSILFQQTLTRYTKAWGHYEPSWYYVTNVLPVMWLPVIALLPWLWPRWRAALRERDTWVGVLLCWIAMVLVFFSASPGKRGVYMLPMLPAFVLVSAPWLPGLMRARGTRRLAFGLATALTVLMAAGALYFAVDGRAAARIVGDYGLQPVLPLAVAAALGALALGLLRLRDAWLAYAGVLAGALAALGFIVHPRMDGERSGRDFMQRLEQASAGIAELGLVGGKDQYLLALRRPSVNFREARWRDRDAVVTDAAAWLAERPGRALLVDSRAREACFAAAAALDLGHANRQHWFLVSGAADEACVRRGDRARAHLYLPPDVSLDTGS
jgi:4-amino-4-deoxy-L-arabinose transferase-like glycosyltransferase